MDTLRYPIGLFTYNEEELGQLFQVWIDEIKQLPTKLRDAVEGLSEAELDTTYRPQGWTVRQVVHHVADSHMNAYIRFKLALTEENPTIKPYDEGEWAQLADSKLDIDISLNLLDALHARWSILIESLTEEDLLKTFSHPEHMSTITLRESVANYAWHGKHHTAHITERFKRIG